jgi:glycolate oxidase FAD binding subunit
VLTEVTFKLLPRPQTEATLVLHGRDDAAGVKILSAALGSPFEVSGAAFLPAGLDGAPSRVLLRLENFADSVAYRISQLQKRIGAGEVLNNEESARLWRAVRNVEFFCGSEEAVWRVSTAPTKAPEFVAAFKAAQNARVFYDWGGGLVWVACAPTLEAGRALRAALAPFGGHATLIRAPQTLRAALEIFQPLPAPLMAAQARVKASLDPDGLFNPALMYAGL